MLFSCLRQNNLSGILLGRWSSNIPLSRVMQRGLPQRTAITGVDKIIVVASGKGGVGKSTIAVNLAVTLSKLGRRTGLLDADLFGPSIPRMMNLSVASSQGLETKNETLVPLVSYGVKCMSMGFLVGEAAPIVWRGLMVMKGIEQLLRQTSWSPLDYLIIDMPPGTGDTQLSISQLVPITGALIVTTPQDVAVSDARKGIEMFRKVSIPIIGIVKNKSRFECPKCHDCIEIYKEGRDHLLGSLQIPIIADIPIDPRISVSSDYGVPTVINNPDSIASKEFLTLSQSIINFNSS